MPTLPSTPPKLPKRLGKPPLVDTMFEVRFEPTRDGAVQLLPGLFLSRLAADYPRSEATPIASIPRELRDSNPSLRYQFHYRMAGDSAAVSVGDRSAGVSVFPPYQGWEFFRPRIDAFVDVLKASALVKRLERFSLKFTNVLDMHAERQLSLLNLDVSVGGVAAKDRGFHLRTELNDAKLLRIVEITPEATVTLVSGATWNGLLVSIDCIKQSESGDLQELTPAAIENVHEEVKQMFFGLITPKTLAALSPAY